MLNFEHNCCHIDDHTFQDDNIMTFVIQLESGILLECMVIVHQDDIVIVFVIETKTWS